LRFGVLSSPNRPQCRAVSDVAIGGVVTGTVVVVVVVVGASVVVVVALGAEVGGADELEQAEITAPQITAADNTDAALGIGLMRLRHQPNLGSSAHRWSWTGHGTPGRRTYDQSRFGG
jgi:hypothetical protein